MKKMIVLSVIASAFISVIALAEHWPSGYYSTVEDPQNAYYYNDENRWYCHIQNATQSALYDVGSQIRVVGDVYGFLSAATSLNECSWPNGFYTVAGGEGPVYRLYPGNICIVTSDAMLAAYGGTDSVIEAEENSDFGSHRTWIGQCFWPSYDTDSKK
jgi:hypothetical protein